MLAVGFFMNLMAVLFVIVCILLILVILVQKGRGGGLSAAFGGGMAGSLLGSKTGDFMTWVTIVLVGVFLLLAVVLARFYRPSGARFGSETTTTVEQGAPTEQPSAPVGEGLGATPVPIEGETETPAPTETVPDTSAVATEPNAAGG